MPDVETRKTVQLPSPGDVVQLRDCGGMIGIVREFDPKDRDRIVLTWPQDSWFLFWHSSEQEFTAKPLTFTILNTPAQVLTALAEQVRQRDIRLADQIRTQVGNKFSEIILTRR